MDKVPKNPIPSHIEPYLTQLNSLVNKDKELKSLLNSILDDKDRPLTLALEIAFYSWNHGKAKTKPSKFLSLLFSALKEWYNSRLSDYTFNTQDKIDAMELARKIGFGEAINTLCKMFTSPEEMAYLRQLALQAIKARRYKEASFMVTFLHMEKEVPLNSLLLPSFFQSNDTYVKNYLNKCGADIQKEFVRTLDIISINNNSVNDFLRSIHFDVPEKKSFIDAKWVRKKLAGFLEAFNIDIKDCPNFFKSRRSGAIHYLVRKRFVDYDIDHIPWEEMVIDTVSGSLEAQKELLTRLVNMNESPSAFRLARLLNMPRNQLPVNLSWQPYREPDEYVLKSDKPDNCLELQLGISICFIDNPKKFEQMVQDITQNYDVVGLDAEWKPSVGLNKERISVFQIGVRDTVYLVDVLTLKDAPGDMWHRFYNNIFKNDKILKLGFNVQHDLEVLREAISSLRASGGNCPNVVDLDHFLQKLKIHYPEVDLLLGEYVEKDLKGLSLVCQRILGKALHKGEQFSNWENRPLRKEQAHYAALDAFCLLLIYEKLFPFLNTHDLDLHKVLTSKRTVPKPTLPPVMGLSDLKCVVDSGVGGVTKFLRHLGADVVQLEERDDPMRAVQISLKDNRVIITCATHYKRVVGYVPPEVCYAADPSLPPKQQVVNILKHFNVKCIDSEIFSRCSLCNNSEYLSVSNEELFRHWHKLVGPEAQQLGRKNTTKFHCNLTTTDGVVHDIHNLQLASFSPQVFERVELFLVCSGCGKVYWEGSHVAHLKQTFSQLIDFHSPREDPEAS